MILRKLNWIVGGMLQALSRATRKLFPRRRGVLGAGDVAPDFTLPREDGTPLRLSELRGKSAVLLVFYPGDHTPVCTRQLCEVRDETKDLAAKGVVAFGVNPAPAATHQSFRASYRLPFPLLVDDRLEVAKLYGARMGVLVRRTVVLIDREGCIRFLEHGNPPLAEVLATLS